MKLAEYLQAVDKSVAAFADDIGTTRQAVQRYLTGERIPRPIVMAKIRAATDGQVTADDFYAEIKPAVKDSPAVPLARAA